MRGIGFNSSAQIVCNLLLYGLLVWQAYQSTIAQWDPWYAAVVLFVLVQAIVITLIPDLHARQISPGEYPYEDGGDTC